MIKNDVLQSIILYGPPGTGKTTIASVIANTMVLTYGIVLSGDESSPVFEDFIQAGNSIFFITSNRIHFSFPKLSPGTYVPANGMGKGNYPYFSKK